MLRKLTLITVGIITLSSPVLAETVKVSVNGMVCAFCVQSITKKLQALDQVSDVKVDLDKKLVTILVKEGENLSDQSVKEGIEKAGYAVNAIERSN